MTAGTSGTTASVSTVGRPSGQPSPCPVDPRQRVVTIGGATACACSVARRQRENRPHGDQPRPQGGRLSDPVARERIERAPAQRAVPAQSGYGDRKGAGEGK